ncbi:MAG: nucleotidyltransferase domain-containing protein [Thermomicrobiales bacterium]
MDHHDANTRFATAYARERDLLRAHLVAALARDPDVQAIWLEGSFGRGTADDVSDLDLGIVIRDERLPAIAADPGAAVRTLVGTCLDIPAPANAPPGGAFVLTWVRWGELEIPFQVDWYWYPASSAIRPDAARVLLDRLPTALAVAVPHRMSRPERDAAIADAIGQALSMALIAAKSIHRGNAWRIASHLIAVDRARLAAAWLLAHDQPIAYPTSRGLGLQGDVPTTRDEQAGVLRGIVADLAAVIAEAGMDAGFADALRLATQYLDGLLGPGDQDAAAATASSSSGEAG